MQEEEEEAKILVRLIDLAEEVKNLDMEICKEEAAELLQERLAVDADQEVDGRLLKNRKIRVYDTHTSDSTQYLIISNIRFS